MKSYVRFIPLLTASLLLSVSAGCSKDSEDGSISDEDRNGSSFVRPSDAIIPSATGSATSSVTGTVYENGATFSADNAKTVAVRQAGVAEGAIEGYECVETSSTGSLVYEITFWVGSIQYFYNISGTDGSVLTFNNQFHQSGYVAPVPEGSVPDFVYVEGNLTEAQARSSVLAHAKLSDYQISNFNIISKTSGNINQYEITFETTSSNYYYTIMAASGTVTYSNVIDKIIIPDVVIPPVTTTPTVTPTTPDVVVPDVVIPETVVPDVTAPAPEPETTTPDLALPALPSEPSTPEPSTPVTPSISSASAKSAAIAQAGFTESMVSRTSVSEIKDSSGSVSEYSVTFFQDENYYTYRVDAYTGAVRNG